MAIEKISGNELEGKLTQGVQIVNIFATWCGPCKMFAPILEEISGETPVFKIDLDENRELAKELNVKGVPTTFIYKDGKVQDTITGFIPKPDLLSRIEKI